MNIFRSTAERDRLTRDVASALTPLAVESCNIPSPNPSVRCVVMAAAEAQKEQKS